VRRLWERRADLASIHFTGRRAGNCACGGVSRCRNEDPVYGHQIGSKFPILHGGVHRGGVSRFRNDDPVHGRQMGSEFPILHVKQDTDMVLLVLLCLRPQARWDPAVRARMGMSA
jgi:hypothetical protein